MNNFKFEGIFKKRNQFCMPNWNIFKFEGIFSNLKEYLKNGTNILCLIEIFKNLKEKMNNFLCLTEIFKKTGQFFMSNGIFSNFNKYSLKKTDTILHFLMSN